MAMLPLKSYSARYEDLSTLGSGSFGCVVLARVRSMQQQQTLRDMAQCVGTLLQPLSIHYRAPTDLVAIKTMTKQLKRPQDYSRVKEVQFILSVAAHFNLVQIMDIFIDKTCFKLHIVMETMEQNLYQLMKARKSVVFSPRTLKSILTQLLSAILHIHRHLFFHRDVKPENILIMQASNYYGKANLSPAQRDHPYIVKLADYGLARHAQNLKPYTAYVSTRWYRSPEILLRQGSYSFPVDIWAFGCVAVECSTFIPLFPGTDELDQTDKVIRFLGSPTGSVTSFGGAWQDAAILARNLQIKLDLTSKGSSLDNVIFRSGFTKHDKVEFFEVVRKCLTWDPHKRATAVGLTYMDYFKNTLVDTRLQKENYPAQKQPYLKNQAEPQLAKPPLLANLAPSLTRKPAVDDFKNFQPVVFHHDSMQVSRISSLRKSAFNKSDTYLTLNNVNDIDIKESNFFNDNQQPRKYLYQQQQNPLQKQQAPVGMESDESEEEEEDDELISPFRNQPIKTYDIDNSFRFNSKDCPNGQQPIIQNRNLIDEIDFALDEELKSYP